MISIVICTRANDISAALKKNINETIGVAYEIIVIDNESNNYSIFSAYNRGVRLSKFDIICFMHDDIFFNSQNWGLIVVDQFQQKNIGAVGVAGTPYYAALPGGWWSGGLICQHINGQKDYAYRPIVNNALPVVVVDGLWFCIKKELFNHISFDEVRFKGFHYYDIDISLQIQDLGFDILSLYNITLTHTSGKLDATWLQNALILQEKWSKKLPFRVIDLKYAQEVKIEYGVLAEYMKAMKLNGANSIKTIQFAVNQILKFRLKRFSIISPFVLIAIASKHLFKKMGLR
jgi:GT2 family glycosyltransferase